MNTTAKTSLMAGMMVLAALAVSGAADAFILARTGCAVNVGGCYNRGNCQANILGTCDGGDCKVNLGICGEGGRCLVNLEECGDAAVELLLPPALLPETASPPSS